MIRYTGWVLAVATPLAILGSFQFVPHPLALVVGGAVIGIFVGYLIYEHTASRSDAPDRVVAEQVLLGMVVLAVLATAV